MTHKAPEMNPAASPRSTAFSRGKFGRLFPSLPPQCMDEPDINALAALAELMVRVEVSASKSTLPAGYTYFGQFIAHDMTFDPTTIGERTADPEFLWNFRTPALDLDSVYGGGPQLTPYLYDEEYKFVVNDHGNDQTPISLMDLQRSRTGVALIVDNRNDENMITARIHLLFQLLHNHFVEVHKEKIRSGNPNQNRRQIFEAAKQDTIWHYQWIILFDYLPRIIGPKILGQLLNLDRTFDKGRKYYDWRNEPFIPVEFASAAFRFGHSQVRDMYKIGQGTLGGFLSAPSRNNFTDLRTKHQFPTLFDMKFFFFDSSKEKHNFAHKIEPSISSALGAIPDFEKSQNTDIQSKVDIINLLSNLVRQKSYKKLLRNKLDVHTLSVILEDIHNSLSVPDNSVTRGIEEINRRNNLNASANRHQQDPKLINELLNMLEGDEKYKDLSKYISKIPKPKFHNLAFRTLLKGCRLALPSGQSIAQKIGVEPKNPVFTFKDKNEEATLEQFKNNTPLWYYILNEAKGLKAKGAYSKRLGEVGATIIGEVIIGLIEGDDNSFWNKNRAWRPSKLGGSKNGQAPRSISSVLNIQDESKNFTMRDIIELLEKKHS